MTFKKRKLKVILGGLLLLNLLGGCSIVSEVVNSKEKEREELRNSIKDGKLDISKAKNAGVISAKEKEKTGYYTEEMAANRKAYKRALEHEQEIKDAMLPIMEKDTERKLKIVGFTAPYPYAAVEIHYQSVDEPYIYGTYTYGVGSDSYVTENKYSASSQFDLATRTVQGLYMMSHKEEFSEMEEYLLKKYPKYQGLLPKQQEKLNRSTPILGIVILVNTVDANSAEERTQLMTESKQKVDTLYQIYKENPDRSIAEWRQLFEETPLDYVLLAALVTKVEDEVPTDEDLHEMLEDMKSSELFVNYYSKNLILKSNLQNTGRDTAFVTKTEKYDPDIERLKERVKESRAQNDE